MSKQGSSGILTSFAVDHGSSVPVYRQIYHELRSAIISGRYMAGTRLPATRVLASELGVSRNTIVTVFDHLLMEGYVHSKIGDGTYVTDTLPEESLMAREASPAPVLQGAPGCTPFTIGENELSSRGRALSEAALTLHYSDPAVQSRPFIADVPAVDAFPTDAWGRLMAKCWHRISAEMLRHVDPAGYEPLRLSISQHLRAARHVRCTADEVVITSGSQQSLDLISRLMIDDGDCVWIEEPGYIGARNVFSAAGAKVVPVPVDEEGLMVDEGIARAPNPKLIFVTPSRQYPLGMTLSDNRRRQLLDFANRTGAWIIEDDYDAEFRYTGTPLPAVQGLVEGGRVIYLGTFSKSLLPAFRLGYVVVPPQLSAVFAITKMTISRHAPILEQMTLHEFMASGRFAAHIRKMRQIYSERQQALLGELSRTLPDFLTVHPTETGMHLVGFFHEPIDDIDFCDAAKQRGITLRPLSIYYLEEPKQTGLILGYAATPVKRMALGVVRLADVAEKFRARKRSG